MKRLLIISVSCGLIFCGSVSGQNVGIGTTTPTGPLSFSSAVGNKIVLWGDGAQAHYGLGIQGGQFQIYANQTTDNIVFGTGRSAAFSERMRIINSGNNGLNLYGRITLLNGTSPVNLAEGTGIWMYKADNSALLGFMGVQNNQNLGFYGGPAGWGFTYDAINSRVGIGNNNPNTPLAFAASLGKKITLYPGGTGDAGFGMAGNRLQIFADNPNADVALGYDVAGTFNEKFAFKPTGAMAVNGNTGTAGQVLKSNGPSAAATWVSGTAATYDGTVSIGGTSSVLVSTYLPLTEIPGLTYTVTTSGNAKLMVSYNVLAYASSCAFCGNSVIDIRLNLDGAEVTLQRFNLLNDQTETLTGTHMLSVGAGTHVIKVKAGISGPAVYIGESPSVFSNNMIVQVINQ